MFYSFEKTVTPSHTKASPWTQRLDIAVGIIHQVDFVFPTDTDKDLHAQIQHGSQQLWPSNTGGAIRGDSMVISFREFFKVDQATNDLKLMAWNTHATDSLLLVVNIGVLPEEILQPFSVERLLKAIGKK
jgi:hypothetical protein